MHEANPPVPAKREHLLARPEQRAAERLPSDQRQRSRIPERSLRSIIEQLRRLPKPSSSLCAVEILLYPPDNRRRDIDNYNKGLFDALTHAGVWEDDSQVKRMLVEWGPVVAKGKVEIMIIKYEPLVGAAEHGKEEIKINRLDEKPSNFPTTSGKSRIW